MGHTGGVSVSGGAWLTREIGRSVDWQILLNGAVLDGGHLFDGDPFSRSAPDTFSFTEPISPGDVIAMKFGHPDYSDFVGVNLSIQGMPIPEPLTAVGVLGAIGTLAGYLRRRARRARC